MENTPVPATPADQPTKACANCGNPQIVAGYNTPLCHDCRQAFIKYPIPLWIKLFAGGIGLIVLFALYTFPKDISTGLHLERGLKAEKQKRFVTAESEYNKVLAKAPGDKEAIAHLMFVAFYNMDYEIFTSNSKKLEGKSIDDDKYMEQLNHMAFLTYEYGNSEEFSVIFKKYGEIMDSIPDTAFVSYLKQKPTDVAALYTYANRLYTKNAFSSCDSITSLILEHDNEYQPALLMKCAANREMSNWDSAISCCDRLLAINKEASYALAAKARVLLKEKKDKEALQEAQEAVAVNKDDMYCQATLAVAYHFNNQLDKRDAIVKQVNQSKDTLGIIEMQFAVDIISGAKKFR